jgi:hypothetical protein
MRVKLYSGQTGGFTFLAGRELCGEHSGLQKSLCFVLPLRSHVVRR